MAIQATQQTTVEAPVRGPEGTLFGVLTAITSVHLLNDMVQSLVPSIYPILKISFHLDFGQIGLITLTSQITASLLQPLIGQFTDRKPTPYSLPIGMTFTLMGLLLLAVAPTFGIILIAASLIGVGSAVFHPESSRVARMASVAVTGWRNRSSRSAEIPDRRFGLLLAALIVLPRGQFGVIWFSAAALLGIVLLLGVSKWYKARILHLKSKPAEQADTHSPLPKKKVVMAIWVLMALVFSKYFYLVSLTSYYTFYLISRFHVSVQSSQLYLFAFLGAVAAGTLIGGPVGDRVGRKAVIWCSILGVLPFTMLLPYVNLFWTAVLSVVIGFVLASAFSAILVYAQELVPGRIGMISGLFFGLAFGMGGIGAAVLGKLADATSIVFVYKVCAYLPAIGLLTWLLPNLKDAKKHDEMELIAE